MSFNIRHLITKIVEWNESLHNSPGRPQLPQRDTEAKEAKGQWVKLRYLRAITTQHQQKGAEANGREQGAHRPGTSQLGSGCGCQGMPWDAKVQHRNMTITKIKFCLPTDGIWALERQPDRLVKEFAISLSTPVCNFNFQQLGSGHTTEKTVPQDCTKICHPAIEIYQDISSIELHVSNHVTTDIYKCHKELSFQDWCHRPSHSCASNEDQQGNRGGTPGFVESVSTNSQPTPTMPSKGAFVHVLLGSPARKCAATCPSRSLMVGLTSTSTRRSASAIWQIMKINTKVNKVKLQMTDFAKMFDLSDMSKERAPFIPSEWKNCLAAKCRFIPWCNWFSQYKAYTKQRVFSANQQVQ